MAKKYWIVWNENRSEGFITDDKMDADSAATYGGTSTVGLAFWESYGDDEGLSELEVEEIEIPNY